MEKGGFRVLVADDDDISRDVIRTLLERNGYPVITAADGLEAIRLLSIQDVQLVISDLRMPGADGLEVLRQAVRHNPDVAVIILTAYGTLDSALEAMRNGAFDYLTKPFKIEEIMFVAEKAYKRAQLISENMELRKELKGFHRDMDSMRRVSESRNVDAVTSCIERIERLAARNVLSAEDASVLIRRIASDNGNAKSPDRR